jgi:photosystem II stability/assembly factor-like uncharacterized protein
MLVLSVGIASLGNSESLAQGGWFQQAIEDEADIYAVAALDANTVIALDARGRLLRISNGVLSVPQSIGVDVPIYGLSFAGSNIGTAVGSGGTILRTTDGGVTWELQDSGTSLDLIGVFLVDENVGTAVGASGTILRTDDGGDTWTPQYADTLAPLFGVSFVNASSGIAVGDEGTILSTSDGGDTWLPQYSGTTRHLQSISFTGPTTTIAVGDSGTVVRTTDGGDNWELEQGGTMVNLYGLAMLDANRGIAVGCETTADGECRRYPDPDRTCGTLHDTFDGGLTWSRRNGGGCYAEALFAVSFFAGDSGAAVGYRGNILYFVDRGETVRNMGWTTYEFHGASMVDANTGWAVGGTAFGTYLAGVIIHTTNGGYPWRWQYSGTVNPLFAVSFVDANVGTAVGAYGTIVQTRDGGATWFPQDSGTSDELSGVFFLNADIGWVAGNNVILHTTDAGDSWSLQQVSLGGRGRVHFADTNNGRAAGMGGNFFRTTDGGGSWTLWTNIWEGQIRDIYMTDGNNITAVVYWPGDPLHDAISLLMRSADGGATWSWSQMARGRGSLVNALTFVNRDTGFAVGGPGVFRTTDHWDTWLRQLAPGPYLAVSFGDANSGTVVGYGRIMRTETGGE